MLNDKKFPEYVQALRMLVVEILRHQLKLIVTLQHVLDDEAFQGWEAKLWSCLIGPVPAIMNYIGALREADWLLHLVAVKEWSPIFCFQPFHLSLLCYVLICIYARKSPIAFHGGSTHNIVWYENPLWDTGMDRVA